MMNMVNDNVVCLRPAEQDSLQSLALTQGNAARQAERLLTEIAEASAEISIQAQGQMDLGRCSASLSSDLQAVMAQIERCQKLWTAFKDI